jgi:hypothetical protein
LIHSLSRIAILSSESPAFFLAARCGIKTRQAPLARPMAHRLHHRAVDVRREVRHGVRNAVRGKSLPECSFWAAGARPIRIPGKAATLMLRKAAAGLRALGLKPASLLRTAHASLPVPRSHRAPAGHGQNQNRRGGDLRTGLRALGHTPFPKTPACAPAPDWRPIPSLRSVIPQAASRARSALDQAPHQSRLGTLLPLSLVGTRSCFCRDLRSLGRPARIVPLNLQTSLPENRLGCGRSPNQASGIEQMRINRNSNIFQSRTKPTIRS